MASQPPSDVRMRGFKHRADVVDVRAWVDALPVPESVEAVAVADAAGRVLAEDVVSDVDVPALPRAAMDGWALRGEDTFGAADADPLELRVVGACLPGATYPHAVRAGEAVRIMTGAPVPDGADAVLPAEVGREREGRLFVLGSVPPARHVGAVGEDVRAGTHLLAVGRTLRPQDVGLAAAVGRAWLSVRALPRVALLVTGDELVPASETPEPGQIRDANTPMLTALVRRDGALVGAMRHAHDHHDAVAAAMRDLPGDVLLVSGGSSVGQEDHAPRVLAELGELVFHGVALRPASPAGCGVCDGRPVFLLPGNPVSCLSAYEFFAGRAVRRFAGRSPEWPHATLRAPLAEKLVSVLGRVDYVRVKRTASGIVPSMARGASILSSTTEADGFVVVPRDSEGWGPGSEVEVFLYD